MWQANIAFDKPSSTVIWSIRLGTQLDPGTNENLNRIKQDTYLNDSRYLVAFYIENIK